MQDRVEDMVFVLMILSMWARLAEGNADFVKDSEYEGKTGWSTW